MAWTTKHLWSPVGGSRTLCGKEARLWPGGTILNACCTDDEAAVTCKACRKIIVACNRAVSSHEDTCTLCERPRGEGKGQCSYEGCRGCKIVQGRLQLQTVRKALDREAGQ
jgi:hypothetical protein